MSDERKSDNVEIPALIVRQWQEEWNKVRWDPKNFQSKPKEHFYLFTLPASQLRKLSGIYRRSAEPGKSRKADLGPQRYHDQKRSEEIGRFRTFGFPWSDLSEAKRESGEFEDLQKPGWLPTSIVVNILEVGDTRDGKQLKQEHAISIEESGPRMAVLHMPSTRRDEDDIPPIEVIDGQHRLWAFAEDDESEEFDLPVVAFHGLDRSWTAYLFWSINIKPKRINASLAFDLYPLLRSEDWLDKFYGHSIYRETRSQELVEALWSHALSPWRARINMLGEPGRGRSMVSQSAWVRSLMASFVRPWDGRGGIGGLYGAPLRQDTLVLPWSRHQQAALLIFIWRCLQSSVAESTAEWANSLRSARPVNGEGIEQDELTDPAFSGPFSLLATDQGVRGVLQVMNDMIYVRAEDLRLIDLAETSQRAATDDEAVADSIGQLKQHEKLSTYVVKIADALSLFDWRTSAFPELNRDQRRDQGAYRGSSGYGLLRQDLITELASQTDYVGDAAREVQNRLGL